MEYRTKLTLHVPCVTRDNGLIKVDYKSFKKRLLEELEAAGVTSFYTQAATGYYKGAEYDEVLWTVFCDPERKDTIIDVFCRTFRESNSFLRQEAFAYECDGKLVVENL